MKKTQENKEFEKEERDMGYRVPDSFFETSKAEILQNISDIALLEKHSDELGMQTPSGYFKDSRKNILREIGAETPRIPKKNTVRSLRWIYAAAALLVIGLFLYRDSVPAATSGSSTDKVTDIFVETDEPNFTEGDLLTLYEDTAMESIFLEDSEADEYLSEYVIENMVLEEVMEE